MANSTLDTSAVPSGITVSGGNLTATATGTGASTRFVPALGAQSTGKYYFEVTTGAGLSSQGTISILDSFGASVTAGSLSAPATVGVAIDLVLGKFWVQNPVGGSWGFGNPALGTGGIDISALAITLGVRPALHFNGAAGDVLTANFGGSAFIGNVPAGFIPGWPPDVTAPKSVRRRRIERWSDWQCAGGVRLAVLADAAQVVATFALDGTDKLGFIVPYRSADAAFCTIAGVIRVEQDDLTFDEWEITGVADADVDGYMHVTAAAFGAVAIGSSDAGLVRRTDSDGVVTHDFDSVGLTPIEHVTQWVLPCFTAAGMTYISLGAVEAAQLIDVTYSWDSPLSALRRIADKCGMELQVRRIGTVGYAIDLVAQIGSSGLIADIRSAKNLVNLGLDRVRADQATRVYPQGQDIDSTHATLARAAWIVTSTSVVGSTTVITLADPAAGDGPLAFDDQLAGAYLRAPDGTLIPIVSSIALTQQMTLTGASLGLAAGDIVEFRADSSGTELTYIESPVYVTDWGVIPYVLPLPDTPGHRNIVENSAMRAWSGASTTPPDDWNVVAGPPAPSLLKSTTPPYYQTAGQALGVVTGGAGADGAGIETANVPIFPSSVNPYVSGFGQIWTVSGTVRVELVYTTPSGEIVHPVSPAIASNSVLGQWESLGVSGEDANALGATAVRLRIVQHGEVAAAFYVDAAQITEGASQLPFIEGSGGTQLWQAANARLVENGPPPLTVSVSVLDLAALDPPLYLNDSSLIVGGRVLVTHPKRGILLGTRITSITRNYDAIGNTTLVLSSNLKDLTGTLAGTGRQPRGTPAVAGPPPPTRIAPKLQVDSVTADDSVLITWSGDYVTLSIDGGTPAPPPASPFLVARPAYGDKDLTYRFTGSLNGVTIPASVLVRAMDAPPSPKLPPDTAYTGVLPGVAPITFHASYRDRIVLTAMPSARTELDSGTHEPFDATSYAAAYVMANVVAAGATGSKLAAEYFDSGSSTWKIIGVSEVYVPIDTIGAFAGTKIGLDAGVTGSLLFRLVTLGGNGVATPVLGNVKLWLIAASTAGSSPALLYFRQTAPSGTVPAASDFPKSPHMIALHTEGGGPYHKTATATVVRSLLRTKGTDTTGVALAYDIPSAASPPTDLFPGALVYGPFTTAQAIPAGPWTITALTDRTTLNQVLVLNPAIYIMRKVSGVWTRQLNIYDNHLGNNGASKVWSTASSHVTELTVTGAAQTVAIGDVLVVEPWGHWTTTPTGLASPATVGHLYYDGATDIPLASPDGGIWGGGYPASYVLPPVVLA